MTGGGADTATASVADQFGIGSGRHHSRAVIVGPDERTV
ncbi:hypothetical protein O981_27595 [Mycobacterium avium 10-5560]|nr:hypothetical protein O981_27595 [Mycobacterium avium 10-5560]